MTTKTKTKLTDQQDAIQAALAMPYHIASWHQTIPAAKREEKYPEATRYYYAMLEWQRILAGRVEYAEAEKARLQAKLGPEFAERWLEAANEAVRAAGWECVRYQLLVTNSIKDKK